jgi:hypothetical protein
MIKGLPRREKQTASGLSTARQTRAYDSTLDLILFFKNLFIVVKWPWPWAFGEIAPANNSETATSQMGANANSSCEVPR